MADFFISFAKADRDWAEWIAWELEAAGFTATFQLWDFRPGASFVGEMENAARLSERTIAVFSPDYLTSGFGSAEWRAAYAEDPTGEKGKLILVRVRETPLNEMLDGRACIDLFNLAEKTARERLLAGTKPQTAEPARATFHPVENVDNRPLFPGEPANPKSSKTQRPPRARSSFATLAGRGLMIALGLAIYLGWIALGNLGRSLLLSQFAEIAQQTEPATPAMGPEAPEAPATPEETTLADLASASGAPQLETGMHRDVIRKLATDAAGRLLATASDDGTIRLWNLANGSLRRTLRPPFAGYKPGQPHPVSAVAISPDGELVAAGGDQVGGIVLLATATGRVVRWIGGVPGGVKDLAFSRDGMRLAIAFYVNPLFFGDIKQGVRVIRLTNGETVWEDDQLNSFGLDFDDRGWLAISSFDEEVRLYDAEMKLLASTKTDRGQLDIRFSPQGDEIAVGHATSARVKILSGAYPLLTELRTLDMHAESSVAWAADGRSLYTGSRWGFRIHRWAEPWTASTEIEVAAGVLDLASLPDGRMVFATEKPGWGILDAEGKIQLYRGPQAIDRQGPLRLDHSGTAVGFSAGSNRRASFSMVRLALSADGAPEVADLDPVLGLPGLDVRLESSGWRINDRWQGLKRGSSYLMPAIIPEGALAEEPLSHALSRDGSAVFLGTTWRLARFDLEGKQIWEQSAPGGAQVVNVSGDGRLVVAALSDGRLRWHRADTGNLLVTLYVHPDLRRWAAWSPAGYFETSPNAGDLLGWQIPFDDDEPAAWVPAKEVPERHRPDVIKRLLRTLGDPVSPEKDPA